MKDNIKLLNFGNDPLRFVFDESGQSWWKLSDVCDILEFSGKDEAITSLDEINKISIKIKTSADEAVFIDQPALYKLISQSSAKCANRLMRFLIYDEAIFTDDELDLDVDFFQPCSDGNIGRLAMVLDKIVEESYKHSCHDYEVSFKKLESLDDISGLEYLRDAMFSHFVWIQEISIKEKRKEKRLKTPVKQKISKNCM